METIRFEDTRSSVIVRSDPEGEGPVRLATRRRETSPPGMWCPRSGSASKDRSRFVEGCAGRCSLAIGNDRRGAARGRDVVAGLPRAPSPAFGGSVIRCAGRVDPADPPVGCQKKRIGRIPPADRTQRLASRPGPSIDAPDPRPRCPSVRHDCMRHVTKASRSNGFRADRGRACRSAGSGAPIAQRRRRASIVPVGCEA